MMRMTFRPLFSLALCILTSVALMAQDDSVGMRSVCLDSVVVTSHRYTSGIRVDAQGDFRWRMQMMDELPKLLGNADPIRYAQMLPGIQTNGEYKSGIHIQGGESSHNDITVNGVPLHNVNHLLGFFSVFNAPHFSTMSVRKVISQGADANRLGGALVMETDTAMADTLSGEASLGLIASQATVHAPLSGRTTLHLSARTSYINLLYGAWLQMEESELRYRFYDTNATLVYRQDEGNLWMFDWYMGEDDGSFGDRNYVADLKAKWGNVMGAVHWLHRQRGWRMRQTAYVSAYRNRFGLDMNQLSFHLPSWRTDIGWRMEAASGRWQMGAELCRHLVQPQQLEVDASFVQNPQPVARQRAWEGALYVDYSQPLARQMTLKLGARIPFYAIQGYRQPLTVDPTLALLWEREHTQFSVSAFRRHQYLFQTGFSDSGLPTEFWFAANGRERPQSAVGVQMTASSFVLDRRYRLTADFFYKRLRRQMDYTGTLFDFIYTEYRLDQWLEQGRGENYGFSLMVNKCTGKLTGWIDFSYTHARRTFRQQAEGRLEGTFPASHERPCELNAVATYTPGKRWSFGATAVYASGTPFTAPQSIALVNGYVVTQYGSHNGARLKPYFRIDLSANYRWGGRRMHEQGINFSLYNASCHANNLFYHIKTTKDGKIGYKPVSFVMFALPSVSYFCKF